MSLLRCHLSALNLVLLPLNSSCNEQHAITRFSVGKRASLQYMATSGYQYTFGLRNCLVDKNLHQTLRCNQSFFSDCSEAKIVRAFRNLSTAGTKCLNEL